MLRRLEAMLVVADKESSLLISGSGDVIEPDDGVLAIGSGGNYALAAARALVRHAPNLTARRDRRGRDEDRGGDLRLYQRTIRNRGTVRPGVEPWQLAQVMTPREIVSELDRYIVGQNDAKRAVAIALRNRWRRQNVPPELRDEIAPKNILMIGPTGVGKTEISRRLAKLAQAPVPEGRGLQVHRGRLRRARRRVDHPRPGRVTVKMVREEERQRVAMPAREAAEERLLDLLFPAPAKARRPVGTHAGGKSPGLVRRRFPSRHPREAAQARCAAAIWTTAKSKWR